MATKIVNGSSDPANAEISNVDLNLILEGYANDVKLSPLRSRQLNKVPSIVMRKEVIQAFLDVPNSGDYISINFGVTLPSQKSCFDTSVDISNQLTIVILHADVSTDSNNTINISERKNVDDYIITPGFKSDKEMIIKLMGMGSPSSPTEVCCGNPNGTGVPTGTGG